MSYLSTSTDSFFLKNIIDAILRAVENGKKEVCQIYWGILMSFLSKNWLIVLIVLVGVLIFAIIKAIMGRWGMLGKLLYNYFYFGILFIVGLIFGPEIFVSNIFAIVCTLLFYPICYFFVGMILDKIGIHR